MLGRPVALHDIDDVEGFVASALERFCRDSQVSLEDDERTELKLEGLCIMFELDRKFEPHRPGYARPGRFSGYAAWALPKRLGDAWHKAHPEHKRITRGDGKREWVYLKGTVSLDAGGRFDDRPADERHLLPAAKWTPVPVAAAA